MTKTINNLFVRKPVIVRFIDKVNKTPARFSVRQQTWGSNLSCSVTCEDDTVKYWAAWVQIADALIAAGYKVSYNIRQHEMVIGESNWVTFEPWNLADFTAYINEQQQLQAKRQAEQDARETERRATRKATWEKQIDAAIELNPELELVRDIDTKNPGWVLLEGDLNRGCGQATLNTDFGKFHATIVWAPTRNWFDRDTDVNLIEVEVAYVNLQAGSINSSRVSNMTVQHVEEALLSVVANYGLHREL